MGRFKDRQSVMTVIKVGCHTQCQPSTNYTNNIQQTQQRSVLQPTQYILHLSRNWKQIFTNSIKENFSSWKY